MKSTVAPVSDPRKGQPTPGKGASRTVPQVSHADNRVEVTAGDREVSRPSGGRHQQPALRTGVASGAVDTKRKDTRKGDRHRPGYQAAKQREYRARKGKGKSP